MLEELEIVVEGCNEEIVNKYKKTLISLLEGFSPVKNINLDIYITNYNRDIPFYYLINYKVCKIDDSLNEEDNLYSFLSCFPNDYIVFMLEKYKNFI